MQEKTSIKDHNELSRNEKIIFTQGSVHISTFITHKQKKVRNAFTEIFQDIDWDVRFPDPERTKITEIDEAYFQALKHWDKKKLYFEKSFFIIVISRNNNLNYELFLNSRSKGVRRIEFKQTLTKIKELEPSCKVYIGQNNPNKAVTPSAFETNLALHLKKIANELKVKIADQFIMSNTEYFSFVENDYMENYHEYGK